jgi:hypothetical protein
LESGVDPENVGIEGSMSFCFVHVAFDHKVRIDAVGFSGARQLRDNRAIGGPREEIAGKLLDEAVDRAVS